MVMLARKDFALSDVHSNIRFLEACSSMQNDHYQFLLWTCPSDAIDNCREKSLETTFIFCLS